jgi:nicotinamide-nucleotide adenylyltransferase
MRKPFLQFALAKAKDLPPKPFQTTLTATSSWPFTADRPASATRPTRIAVLDSSFNPPTKAHYQLLKAAARVGCDAVLLLLATNNVDKGQTGAGAVERLEMMEAVAMDSIQNEKEDPALRHMAVGLTVS